MTQIEVGETLVGAEIQRVLAVEAIRLERHAIDGPAQGIARQQREAAAESLVERKLQCVVGRVDYVLVADNARMSRSIYPAAVYVGKRSPGAKERRIEFAANGQPCRLGAHICGGEKIVGGEFSLHVQVPLLVVGSAVERIDREPDCNRQ